MKECKLVKNGKPGHSIHIGFCAGRSDAEKNDFITENWDEIKRLENLYPESEVMFF